MPQVTAGLRKALGVLVRSEEGGEEGEEEGEEEGGGVEGSPHLQGAPGVVTRMLCPSSFPNPGSLCGGEAI